MRTTIHRQTIWTKGLRVIYRWCHTTWERWRDTPWEHYAQQEEQRRGFLDVKAFWYFLSSCPKNRPASAINQSTYHLSEWTVRMEEWDSESIRERESEWVERVREWVRESQQLSSIRLAPYHWLSAPQTGSMYIFREVGQLPYQK